MKKSVLCICMITACLLTACGGGGEKVISGEVNNVTEGTAAGAGLEAAEGQEETMAEEAAVATHGYVFVNEGVSIEIDGEATPYIDGMSEKPSVYESPSCAFGELDKIHTYSAFEMDTYALDGVDYVSAVILFNDTVTTAEGIGIGAAVDEVKAAYGEPTFEEAAMLTYEKDQMKLCFLLKDGAVISVEYRTMVLG